jgi:hypothetical protein
MARWRSLALCGVAVVVLVVAFQGYRDPVELEEKKEGQKVAEENQALHHLSSSTLVQV